MIKNRIQIALLLSLFIILGLGFIAGQTARQEPKPEPAPWSGDYMKGWQQYDQLVKEQKYEAASSLVEEMLAKARSGKNSAEWTRCLIRYTQLRMALHGYETSVRFLKDQPWPEDLMGSSILNLYYAHALANYARSYSWEINSRERIDTKGAVDLKAWTRDQIYEEAQKAFEIVWRVRENLEKPIAEWKEFLLPNSYPAGIRPTLRDAVSYMRVDMLADTNGWQPDQLNEIYRLNLKDLIGGRTGEISLIDPARHPLEKISFILADLENRHAQKEEREAALEARLERYRQLHQHFTDAEDRDLIRNDLEKHLKTLSGVPWWSEGMAQLAEFAKAENEPDSLIRARQFSIQGRSAFPGSIGG
ncbi:MAG: hypothetical protein H6Q07_1913, partial [Acidobacteria bacterium]|nr:hypothetical protein [Acidobacteriota bacterium]